MKESSFAGDAIKGGRSDHGVIGVGRGMRPAPVIGDAEKDIGAPGGLAAEGEKEEGE